MVNSSCFVKALFLASVLFISLIIIILLRPKMLQVNNKNQYFPPQTKNIFQLSSSLLTWELYWVASVALLSTPTSSSSSKPSPAVSVPILYSPSQSLIISNSQPRHNMTPWVYILIILIFGTIWAKNFFGPSVVIEDIGKIRISL